jgi:hypothetical protein
LDPAAASPKADSTTAGTVPWRGAPSPGGTTDTTTAPFANDPSSPAFQDQISDVRRTLRDQDPVCFGSSRMTVRVR